MLEQAEGSKDAIPHPDEARRVSGKSSDDGEEGASEKSNEIKQPQGDLDCLLVLTLIIGQSSLWFSLLVVLEGDLA